MTRLRWHGKRIRTAADLRKALRKPRIAVRLAVFLHGRDVPALFVASKSEVLRALHGEASNYAVRAVILHPSRDDHLDVVVVGVPSLLVNAPGPETAS
ncbi:MAG: hypothetical protein F4Y03_09455 [Alphaproteobacteria bacterium]|nr:hypothetical protein [Alphaproteobacteria bacterium]